MLTNTQQPHGLRSDVVLVYAHGLLNVPCMYVFMYVCMSTCYSAPSRFLLRGAPDYSADTESEFHAEAHEQLRVKDLPRVPTRRLEVDSNPQPYVCFYSSVQLCLCWACQLESPFSRTAARAPQFGLGMSLMSLFLKWHFLNVRLQFKLLFDIVGL